jgi:hypothetical protein
MESHVSKKARRVNHTGQPHRTDDALNQSRVFKVSPRRADPR